MSDISCGKRISVAVVGSGPSAIFTIEALLESGSDVEIAVIERLPVPFGLVRFGVAPDHQATKRVSDTMGAVLADLRVKFYGNVAVGADISLPELRRRFDAVVLAYGASKDARLGIEGENLKHAIGSSAMVGWYNGHPDHAALGPKLSGSTAVIIGMGNVALDIARILSKSPEQLLATDAARHAIAELLLSNVSDIIIIGRGGPINAKFSYPELRELQSLEDAVLVTDPLPFADDIAAATKAQRRIVDLLRSFSANDPHSKRKRIQFVFNAMPVRICGDESVESIVIEQRTQHAIQRREIACQLVVSAIGYRSAALPDAPFDEGRSIIPNSDGRVDDRLFVVGWLGRGPSGVIGTNKPDAYRVATQIVANGPVARAGQPLHELESVFKAKHIKWVSKESWQKIDDAERSSGNVRVKMVDVRAMLQIAEA